MPFKLERFFTFVFLKVLSCSLAGRAERYYKKHMNCKANGNVLFQMLQSIVMSGKMFKKRT